MDTLVGIWIGCGLIVAMITLVTGESEGIRRFNFFEILSA